MKPPRKPMSAAQRARFLSRLADKVRRVAYEMEYDAGRCRRAGLDPIAESLRHPSSKIGDIGRRIERQAAEESR